MYKILFRITTLKSALTTKVGNGRFVFGEQYRTTTSQSGTINLSTLMGLSIATSAIVNIVATSGDYVGGLFAYPTVSAGEHWVVIFDIDNTTKIKSKVINLSVSYYIID